MTLDADCDVCGSDDLTVSQRTGSVEQREGVDERVLSQLKHSLLLEKALFMIAHPPYGSWTLMPEIKLASKSK